MTTYSELVMTAAAIAERLGQGKQRETKANGWLTCCPAHEDDNPSLEIFVDQNIRFVCYSGCADEDIRAGIIRAGFREIPEISRYKGAGGGIKVNKIAHEERPSDEWFLSAFSAVPDRIYPYRNANNQVQFLVARFEANPPENPEKRIKPVVSARARGGTIDFWNAQAYPQLRPLYNLPDLAARPNSPVLLVEGEKTADAAAYMLPEYVVVTWAGGANAVKTAAWGPLASRNVVMWPDNDAPGIKAMQDISLLIAKGKTAAKSIKLVLEEIDDTFPKSFDLGDPYDDAYTPIGYMLGQAANLDPTKLPDVALPADEEEVSTRVADLLEKYAVISVGVDHQYVDVSSRSPFVSDMIPYMRYSKHTLEQKEAEAFIEISGKGGAKRRRYVDVYIESPKRVWLHGYVYDPSSQERYIRRGDRIFLNLYCGFAHPPKQCDAKLYQCFVDHIYASCETPEEGDYILDWFAAKLQNPDLMIGTMIILSGREGCGKTIVCDIINKLLGPHNAVKIPMSELVSSFNSHYCNKLMVNVEEYNPGASKQQRDLREKVKNLITSQSMVINTKGLPAYENPAYHSVIATTNARTAEDISFDNRRMTFIRFDNPNLKMQGSRIEDDAYFAPIVALSKLPQALSGLCYFLMNRDVSISRVMKPLDTAMTKEARTFTENSAFDFLRMLAETLVLPDDVDLPNDDNPYPVSQWPQAACAIPRSTLNKMFRSYLKDGIGKDKAGKLLSKALGDYPRGIPESYTRDAVRRWKMTNDRDAVYELKDRAFCLPDVAELRYLVEAQAGEAISWSEISPADNPSDGVVVDFPGKKPSDDIDLF
jgi:hypothetical protein